MLVCGEGPVEITQRLLVQSESTMSNYPRYKAGFEIVHYNSVFQPEQRAPSIGQDPKIILLNPDPDYILLIVVELW